MIATHSGKNMIIAHSEKSMATLPEQNYWLHILEKHVFLAHSVKMHDC